MLDISQHHSWKWMRSFHFFFVHGVCRCRSWVDFGSRWKKMRVGPKCRNVTFAFSSTDWRGVFCLSGLFWQTPKCRNAEIQFKYGLALLVDGTPPSKTWYELLRVSWINYSKRKQDTTNAKRSNVQISPGSHLQSPLATPLSPNAKSYVGVR